VAPRQPERPASKTGTGQALVNYVSNSPALCRERRQQLAGPRRLPRHGGLGPHHHPARRPRPASLQAGEPGVAAEVAAVVVADQDPVVAVQDPEPGDRRPGEVPGRAAPDQVRPALFRLRARASPARYRQALQAAPPRPLPQPLTCRCPAEVEDRPGLDNRNSNFVSSWQQQADDGGTQPGKGHDQGPEY
jgi:hypothetical protein